MLALCIAAVASSCTDGDGSLNLNGALVAMGHLPETELCPGFIHYVATIEEGDGTRRRCHVSCACSSPMTCR